MNQQTESYPFSITGISLAVIKLLNDAIKQLSATRTTGPLTNLKSLPVLLCVKFSLNCKDRSSLA